MASIARLSSSKMNQTASIRQEKSANMASLAWMLLLFAVAAWSEETVTAVSVTEVPDSFGSVSSVATEEVAALSGLSTDPQLGSPITGERLEDDASLNSLNTKDARTAAARCPVAACPKPMPGCKFVPSDELNADGCKKNSCGIIKCAKKQCSAVPKPAAVCCKALTPACLGCTRGCTGLEFCAEDPSHQVCNKNDSSEQPRKARAKRLKPKQVSKSNAEDQPNAHALKKAFISGFKKACKLLKERRHRPTRAVRRGKKHAVRKGMKRTVYRGEKQAVRRGTKRAVRRLTKAPRRAAFDWPSLVPRLEAVLHPRRSEGETTLAEIDLTAYQIEPALVGADGKCNTCVTMKQMNLLRQPNIRKPNRQPMHQTCVDYFKLPLLSWAEHMKKKNGPKTPGVVGWGNPRVTWQHGMGSYMYVQSHVSHTFTHSSLSPIVRSAQGVHAFLNHGHAMNTYTNRYLPYLSQTVSRVDLQTVETEVVLTRPALKCKVNKNIVATYPLVADKVCQLYVYSRSLEHDTRFNKTCIHIGDKKMPYDKQCHYTIKHHLDLLPCKDAHAVQALIDTPAKGTEIKFDTVYESMPRKSKKHYPRWGWIEHLSPKLGIAVDRDYIFVLGGGEHARRFLLHAYLDFVTLSVSYLCLVLTLNFC